MSDPVKAPAHYAGNGAIECKHAMASMLHEAPVTPVQACWWAASLKYFWRWCRKNGVQDIDKAIECLTELRKTVAE